MPNGSKAEFTRYSSDPFLIFSSRVAQISSVTQTCKPRKKHMNLDVVRSESGLLHMWK